jgi:hypothetical protein
MKADKQMGRHCQGAAVSSPPQDDLEIAPPWISHAGLPAPR